ncbi:type 1 glutamine amidotransferase [Azospirillum isscasi]|uniref:Type 1 glutamine amidotransferase n=1 Tax=Azospirillum isscasi TaxID=3053926 RepID=A0ABU0WEK8_9PROT|nr:type 1 glutamine amidotransferase [Azospirillum isscasi]MDQ2102633.1 type 1 glutamine amidotransferase [Azospirillum isscasi]
MNGGTPFSLHRSIGRGRPMRILVVQNNRNAPAGIVGEALADFGAALVTVAADEGEALPAAPEGYHGLLVLGGPQDAWNDAQGPHFPQVMDLIRAFAAQEHPVMGICLGAQLAARAFGARVYRHSVAEIGVGAVRLSDAAADDPLLGGLAPELHMVQWHYDTFEFPEGAVPLARSEACERQAFRLGRNLYAFQFHPEANAAIVRGWAEKFGVESRERDRGVLDGLDAALERHLPAAGTAARTISRRWLDLVIERAA